MRARAVFHFVDNNDKRAQTSIWLPDTAIANDGGVSLADSVAAKLAAVSDAYLDHYDITFKKIQGEGAPAPTADCFTRLLLFFRNGSEADTISVPAPGSLPFDVDGPFRGYRLTRDALLLSGLLDDVESISTLLRRADGTPFPVNFAVGAIARNVL